jgi:uncharacterized membrane protein YecN with MAPEG domain
VDETLSFAAGRAAALWAGLNLLVLLTLSGLVVRQRGRHRVAIGDGGVPELVRALRAFGNAAEYIPAGMAALAILAIAGAPAGLIHAIGAILFVGRIVHGASLSVSEGPSLGRSAGMLMTWLAWLAAAVSLIFLGV